MTGREIEYRLGSGRKITRSEQWWRQKAEKGIYPVNLTVEVPSARHSMHDRVKFPLGIFPIKIRVISWSDPVVDLVRP